jgi:hypothetical protein
MSFSVATEKKQQRRKMPDLSDYADAVLIADMALEKAHSNLIEAEELADDARRNYVKAQELLREAEANLLEFTKKVGESDE